MNTIKYGAGVLAISAVLAACGGGYDRGEARDELIEGGLTEEQADCVLDIAEDEIGTDRLGEDDDPTAEEMEIITSAVTECTAGG